MVVCPPQVFRAAIRRLQSPIRLKSEQPSFALYPSSPMHLDIVYEEVAVGPRAPFGAPLWKPFLNLREMSLSERVRPEPVVFLRLAFSPQLSAGMVSVKLFAPGELESRGNRIR